LFLFAVCLDQYGDRLVGPPPRYYTFLARRRSPHIRTGGCKVRG